MEQSCSLLCCILLYIHEQEIKRKMAVAYQIGKPKHYSPKRAQKWTGLVGMDQLMSVLHLERSESAIPSRQTTKSIFTRRAPSKMKLPILPSCCSRIDWRAPKTLAACSGECILSVLVVRSSILDQWLTRIDISVGKRRRVLSAGRLDAGRGRWSTRGIDSRTYVTPSLLCNCLSPRRAHPNECLRGRFPVARARIAGL